MLKGNNDNGNQPPHEPEPEQGSVHERLGGTHEPGGGIGPIHGTDEPYTDHNDDHNHDPDDDLDADMDDEPPARRKWFRNAVIGLLVAALIGNILAFWPQIYNMETLPLLFKSRELSGRKEVRHYKKAVVLVATDKGKGSGFHVSDGYIVTNYHVIEDAAYFIVEFPGENARFAADVVRFDPDLDLAVLQVDSGGKRLPAIEIEREHDWEPGAHVYVIGNPLDLKQIASEGKVLGMLPIQGRSQPVMAIDAPVHKGSSGSPVINEHGRAIAVIYAAGEIMDQGGKKQVGLAVPLRDLDALLPELPEHEAGGP